jgi:hypothetical protein
MDSPTDFPTVLYDIILNYKYQLDHYFKFKKTLNVIKNKNFKKIQYDYVRFNIFDHEIRSNVLGFYYNNFNGYKTFIAILVENNFKNVVYKNYIDLKYDFILDTYDEIHSYDY